MKNRITHSNKLNISALARDTGFSYGQIYRLVMAETILTPTSGKLGGEWTPEQYAKLVDTLVKFRQSKQAGRRLENQ